MRRSIILGVGLFLVFVVAGCKRDSAKDRAKVEALVEETFTALNDLADALESIKDPASAKTAAKKIHNAFDRLEEIGKKANALPKLSQSDKDALRDKYKDDLKKVSKRIESAGFEAGKMAGNNNPDLLNAIRRQETVDTFPFDFIWR